MSKFNWNNYKEFDWKYYIDKYSDLRNANILTETKARKHFELFGYRENRKYFKKYENNSTENNSTENNSTENKSTENKSTENNSTENNSTENNSTKNNSTELNDKDILCITTFNKKLYDDYAYRFIETYNLPFDLVIYGEDDLSFLKDKVNYNLKVYNTFNEIPEIVNFIKKYTPRNILDSKKGFRWDSIRFCYKVFSVSHTGLNNKKYKYLIWLDADIIFKKPFNSNIFLEKMINPNYMMSYLGRSKKYHSECGFLIFNLKHKYINNYFKEMIKIYITGNIYKEKEWHDSYIWDLIRKRFETKYKIKNYNLGFDNYINDIIGQSFLFNYFYHLKGKRKYNYPN